MSSDRATRLGAALIAALDETAPSATSPEWVTLDAEARRRGLTTGALRSWCLKHGLIIRAESHRRAWVQPRAIDGVIEALPAAVPASARRAPCATRDALDEEIDRKTTRPR